MKNDTLNWKTVCAEIGPAVNTNVLPPHHTCYLKPKHDTSHACSCGYTWSKESG